MVLSCIYLGNTQSIFLTTSGCIQDPISLTSQWITAATDGFTSSYTVKKKKKTAQGLTAHTHTRIHKPPNFYLVDMQKKDLSRAADKVQKKFDFFFK